MTRRRAGMPRACRVAALCYTGNQICPLAWLGANGREPAMHSANPRRERSRPGAPPAVNKGDATMSDKMNGTQVQEIKDFVHAELSAAISSVVKWVVGLVFGAIVLVGTVIGLYTQWVTAIAG